MANIQTKDTKFNIVTAAGDTIRLDKETVIKYITNGVVVTDPEYNMFFQLCKVHKVNPFLKEAYLIKYGNTPATIVLDYKVYQRIAEEHPHFKGMKHGVIVSDKDGKIIERVGAFKTPDELLLAGWCEVYRDDKETTKIVASFDEFKNVKKDGTANSNWAGKPCFMIDKVAKAQALREAFPKSYGSNIYIPEEVENMSATKQDNAQEKKTTVSMDFVENEETVEVNPEPKEVDEATGEVTPEQFLSDLNGRKLPF